MKDFIQIQFYKFRKNKINNQKFVKLLYITLILFGYLTKTILEKIIF